MPKTVGELLAADLPVTDEDSASDLISLQDIVITGIETGWTHFWVSQYDFEAPGTDDQPWAILRPLADAGAGDVTPLTAAVVRDAVTRYADKHIDRGTPLEEVRKLLDGSYTDAVIADSILQIAVYGQELYS
jgi:hypothetical protein